MKNIDLRIYQENAVESAIRAIKAGKHRILIEMVTGTGMTIVFSELLEELIDKESKILVVAPNSSEKDKLDCIISDYASSRSSKENYKKAVHLVTQHWVQVHWNEIEIQSYSYVIVFGLEHIGEVDSVIQKLDAVIIGFLQNSQEINRYALNDKKENKEHALFKDEDCVFKYTLEEAIRDGYLSPKASPALYDLAAEGFCKRLFEKFGCSLVNNNQMKTTAFFRTDLAFSFEEKRLCVECKIGRSEYFSLQALNLSASRICKYVQSEHGENKETIILIIFNKVNANDKQFIYDTYNILVWDISNLLYYAQHDNELYETLSRLSYYPISTIKALEPLGWKPPKRDFSFSSQYIKEKVDTLKGKLAECKPGRESSQKYESVCQEIVEFLFSNAFFTISNQYKTEDSHFRMDLICSLSGESEHRHIFWKLLSRHYNSHFVVFEFKNYENKIDQNLIYITEKYLFDAALRNVAIIISRQGFSDSARFAAGGCLKEHGKLILSLSDADLTQMLDMKLDSNEPEDYILTVFEDFLMKISK